MKNMNEIKVTEEVVIVEQPWWKRCNLITFDVSKEQYKKKKETAIEKKSELRFLMFENMPCSRDVRELKLR